MSACSNAATYRLSSSRSSGSLTGRGVSGKCWSIVARARCSALVTDATVDPTARRPPGPSSRGHHGRSTPRAGDPAAPGWHATGPAPSPPGSRNAQPGRTSARRRRQTTGPGTDRLALAGVAGVELIEARVGRDAIQPCLELCSGLKAFQCPPRPQQRLLGQILGVLCGPQHPIAMNLKRVPVGFDELAKRSLIPGLRGCQQETLIDVLGPRALIGTRHGGGSRAAIPRPRRVPSASGRGTGSRASGIRRRARSSSTSGRRPRRGG